MFDDRVNPFNSFDATHPLLSYVVREVRGGRTPEGLVRYSRRTLWILGGLLFGGLFVAIALYQPVFQPSYTDDEWALQIAALYTVGAFAVSIFTFPIVDFVTVFYAVNSIRSEMRQDVKFDLLRATTLSPYVFAASRLTLARVRAWRFFVLMWQLRILCCFLAGFVLLWAVLAFGGSTPDPAMGYFIFGAVIFVVMLVWEPLWRFRMMTNLAASFAARFRSDLAVWLAVGGSLLAVGTLQLMLAVGVGWMGFYMNILPYMAMPFVVWTLQKGLADWREQVLVDNLFRWKGEDA